MHDTIYATGDSFNKVEDELNLLIYRLKSINESKFSNAEFLRVQTDIENVIHKFHDFQNTFKKLKDGYFQQ